MFVQDTQRCLSSWSLYSYYDVDKFLAHRVSSLLKLNFLICKLGGGGKKTRGEVDGEVFDKIQGTVNYCVNQFK